MNDFLSSIIETIIGIIIGGAITFIVSRHYYVRASKDLRIEASELKKTNQMVTIGHGKNGMGKIEPRQKWEYYWICL